MKQTEKLYLILLVLCCHMFFNNLIIPTVSKVKEKIKGLRTCHFVVNNISRKGHLLPLSVNA